MSTTTNLTTAAKEQTNLLQQLEAFKAGNILESDGSVNTRCYNFFDWFCKDSSLERKARRLFSSVKSFVKHNPEIDLTKHYVFFTNNCPMRGPLYDEFRIVNIEQDEVVWSVTPKSGHTGMAEIWGIQNDFDGPLKTADTYKELFKQ